MTVQVVKKPKPKLVYQFYVALLGVEPMIWRRVRVPENITFKKFHEILQVVMGWQDYHLYEFRYGPIRVGIPDGGHFIPDSELTFDSSRKQLKSMRFATDDVFSYTYDFGDNWVHMIRLEHIMYEDEKYPSLFCWNGARSCPPEDVGGSSGYQNFLEVIKNRKHPERKHLLEWAGGNFDAEHFDVIEVNETLSELFKK